MCVHLRLREKRGEPANELRALGIRNSMLFPDLEHLAQELAEDFGKGQA